MNTRSDGLRLLACGGTLDKRYDPIRGELCFVESQLPAMVARARLTIAVTVETVMQIANGSSRPAGEPRSRRS